MVFCLIMVMAVAGLTALASAIPALAKNEETTDYNLTKRGYRSEESNKRGIVYNNAAFTQYFQVDGSKISWMYNWAHNPGPAGGGYEYTPMLWSNRDDAQLGTWHEDVQHALSAGRTWHILGFNEPDKCPVSDGSCMPDLPGTAIAYKAWVTKVKEVNDWSRHKDLSIGGPAVTNGQYDAATGRAMGLSWLQKFLDACKSLDCKIDFLPIHWYDQAWNVQYFKNHVNDACNLAAQYGIKHVWVTEFSPWDGDESTKIGFLREVLPWLDEQLCVEKYAMFMAAPGRLINAAGTGLSDLGRQYATI